MTRYSKKFIFDVSYFCIITRLFGQITNVGCLIFNSSQRSSTRLSSNTRTLLFYLSNFSIMTGFLTNPIVSGVSLSAMLCVILCGIYLPSVVYNFLIIVQQLHWKLIKTDQNQFSFPDLIANLSYTDFFRNTIIYWITQLILINMNSF